VLAMSTRSRVPAPVVHAAVQPIVRSVAAGALLTEVLRAVIDEANSVVGVLSSSGQLVGTISERDILRCLPPASSPGAAAQAYARFLQLRAADVMDDVGLGEEAG
jgi:CBS-domain-containing membrane protein